MLLAVDVVLVDIMTILNFESTDVILSLAFLWSSFVSMFTFPDSNKLHCTAKFFESNHGG